MRKINQEITDPGSKREGVAVILAPHGAPELADFEEHELNRMVILKISIVSITGKQSSNWNDSTE